jgi:hypothetical protein
MFRQKNMMFTAISFFGEPIYQSLLFHTHQSSVDSRFGKVGTLSQITLGQSLFIPQNPQEDPLPKRNTVFDQTSRERSIKATRAQSGQMCYTLFSEVFAGFGATKRLDFGIRHQLFHFLLFPIAWWVLQRIKRDKIQQYNKITTILCFRLQG